MFGIVFIALVLMAMVVYVVGRIRGPEPVEIAVEQPARTDGPPLA